MSRGSLHFGFIRCKMKTRLGADANDDEMECERRSHRGVQL
jgi:hypothetical protein